MRAIRCRRYGYAARCDTPTIFEALRGRSDIHIHKHTHDGETHAHIHFHEKPVGAPLRGRPRLGQHTDDANAHDGHAPTHTHAISKIGLKPLVVGAMHGLAGSAALTLLVLTQINSIVLGLLYLAVFGIGSIFGMLLMSGLIGLPFALSARRLSGVNYGLQSIAGVLSIAFGLWYAYQVGTANGFWGSIL